MKMRKLGLMVATAAMTFAAGAATAAEQYIPSLVYRTGPYASGGAPWADGFADYFQLINERDGGVNGVKFKVEECETGYKTDRGVECYDRTKDGATVYNPLSTGITYALLDKAAADQIPILSMGYGRTSAADGRVFKYVFNPPATYWNQLTSIVKYIGDEMGGMDNLKGKKIAYIYLDHPYGKEPIPTMDVLSEQYGFEYDKYPVAPKSMTEQKSIWLQIRKTRPDYVVMWGWGAMNATAVKEATNIRFDMTKFIGNWWSAGEDTAIPSGAKAKGYRAATFHGVGTDYPVFEDVKKHLQDTGMATSGGDKIGQTLYNRGFVNAALIVEAVRKAQEKYGERVLTGEEFRWGLENLDITDARIAEMGMSGLMPPTKITCENHEGANPAVKIQEWDGSQYQVITDWIPSMTQVTRPLVEQDAAAYAAEKGMELRSCN